MNLAYNQGDLVQHALRASAAIPGISTGKNVAMKAWDVQGLVKKAKVFASATLLVTGVSVGADALVIDPAVSTIEASGSQTAQPAIDAIIFPIIGPATELYKSNVGTGEEALPLAGSYETEFFNTPSDPMDANITYISGPTVGPIAWLLRV